MYYCKSRFYVPKWRRWLNSDSIDYLEPQNITCLNLFAYCNNNPVMYVDENGNMPKWAQWLIGGALIVGAVALTIATVSVGGSLALAMGGGFWTSVAGGAISGAAVGTVTGALMSAGNQIFANGFENFDWLEVGKGSLAGGISGGIFGGIQQVLSAKKNADGVSGIRKAQARLDDALKPLRNVKK